MGIKIFALVLALVTLSCASGQRQEVSDVKQILIIGHRGASGSRPEHTLASYQLAIEQGADYIEPDVVITKDKVLVARHENEISETTDVALKFPERKTTKSIDGDEVTGWFAEDFTLKELKTLRAKERLERRDQSFNGLYPIPTLSEVIALAQNQSRKFGRKIGVYVETKHPSYFRSIGLELEPVLAKELKSAGWDKGSDPVIIQSFEPSSLKRMDELVESKLVFLYGDPKERPYDGVMNGDPRTYSDYMSSEELKTLSEFLHGIGPYKGLILAPRPNGGFGEPTTLVEDAHHHGLVVHPYTFRSDHPFLDKDYRGKPEAEYHRFFDLGVDGVFSDFPKHAIEARESWLKAQEK